MSEMLLEGCMCGVIWRFALLKGQVLAALIGMDGGVPDARRRFLVEGNDE
jgi:hypothetical protein